MDKTTDMKPWADKLYIFIKLLFAGLVLFVPVLFACLIIKCPHADRSTFGYTDLVMAGKPVHLYLAKLVFAVALFIIAMMAIIIGTILRISKKMITPITTLGIGVLFASLWLIFDSHFCRLAFSHCDIDEAMSFVIILLVPYPFIYYLSFLQEKRYREIYGLLCLFIEVLSVVSLIVHFAGHVGLSSMAPIIGVIEGAAIAGVLYTLIKDYMSGQFREYFLSFVGVGGLAVFCIIELLMYMAVGGDNGGAFIITGLFWTVMLGILHQLYMVREAQQKAAMAVRASETKTNFLANMSHEIRTPMNAILGMDEMILREAKENPRILKYAQDIKSAGNMLLSIINGILDLSKIESGKAELVELDFDIRAVINDLVNIVKKRAKDKNLEFTFEAAGDIPIKLHGDETRIRQIMLNIINNAIKYTNEGSVKVVLGKTAAEAPENGIALVLTVKDTGIGIREEDIGKLFQPFDRLEQTKNRNIEGTGLGLNIAATYVKLMGGNIDVKSVYGEGSVFTVTMPVKVVEDAPIGDISRSISEMRDSEITYESFMVAPGASVLVIDDNEMNLEVISGLLERTRMRVDLAKSGADGINMMRKRRYDIILLDQMMPGMDGITTLKKMQSEFDMQGIPVIALTADAVTGAREFYLENGFDGYLSKPVKPEALEEMLIHRLPGKLVVFRDYDDKLDRTVRLDSPRASQKDASDTATKTMIAIDKDSDSLKYVKEKTGSAFKGTFVTDMDKAQRYLEKHDVDYVLVSREVFEDLIQ